MQNPAYQTSYLILYIKINMQDNVESSFHSAELTDWYGLL